MEMRKKYYETLETLLAENKKVVILDADLASASGTSKLYNEYPKQAINVGISEANMISSAAGMSRTGLIPFVHTFAPFASRRVLDQLYMSGVYSNNTLHIYASDPGYWAQHNGGTHTTYEDLSAVLAFPNIHVMAPSDPAQFAWILKNYTENKGVYYTRAPRKELPDLYDENMTFELGKAIVHGNSSDAVIFAHGEMVHEALAAQKALKEEEIHVTVADMFSLKPFDRETTIKLAQSSDLILTAENHQRHGGLGSIVERILTEERIFKPYEAVAVDDVFGEVGDANYLKEKHGLTADNIIKKIKENL